MYILLAAATPFEIAPFSAFLAASGSGHQVEVLVTGIGSAIATWSLAKAINQRKPDFMVQAGIAGGFGPNFSPPQVVIVKNEIMGDLGAAENSGFSDVFDLGLMDGSVFPFSNKRLENPLAGGNYGLPVAQGVTVNEISTNAGRIALLKDKYKAEIESMEGAAFHYAALMENIPFLQLRAVSNIVGERNKQHWQIKEAIGELNKTLISLLPQLK